MRSIVSMACDSFNKKGLKGYKTYPLTASDKMLAQQAKSIMKYRGKTTTDTINHMCQFLFNVEQSGKTGFIIESLLDQSGLMPIDQGYNKVKSLNSVIPQQMSRAEFADYDMKRNGFKYAYYEFDYNLHLAMIWQLNITYMKQVLYTFIKMLKYIKPNSEDPTDADDVISDLGLNKH